MARREQRGRKKYKPTRKKPANTFLNKLEWVDYKEINFIKRFVNDKNKLIAKRSTGVNGKVQRLIVKAVKNAREMALIPYCTSR